MKKIVRTFIGLSLLGVMCLYFCNSLVKMEFNPVRWDGESVGTIIFVCIGWFIISGITSVFYIDMEED